MVLIESNEGPEPVPVQAEPSSRKRKRLTIAVCQVLLVVLVIKKTSSLIDADSVLAQARDTWMLLNRLLPDLIEFILRHAHSLAAVRKRRRTHSLVAGRPNISLVMIQEVVRPPQLVRPPQPPTKRLKFANPLKLPIFTNRKLTSHEDNQSPQLEVQLINIETGEICIESSLQVEIVVLDGDFCPHDQQDWMSDQFNTSILSPRNQKGPLLVSTVKQKVIRRLENGVGSFDDLVITDNSTLAKNNKFRLGARVTNYQGPRIIEAWSEDFRVRDCRGEKDEKHDPPSLDDEVWRLKHIAKGGKYHKIMSSFKNREEVSVPIKTVRDFVTMQKTDREHLKNTLKISEKRWKEIVEQAERALVHGETSTGGNETQPNPAQQDLAPTTHRETPLENMGVSQQVNLPTDSQFDPTESIPTYSTINQGPATNYFVPGETSMLNSGGNETQLIPAQQVVVSTMHHPRPIPPENTFVLQQLDSQIGSQFDQTNSTFNRGHTTNDLILGEMSMPISGGYETEADPFPRFLLSTTNLPHSFENMGMSHFGLDQIWSGLGMSAPTFNGDVAIQPNVNQYDDEGQLQTDEDLVDTFISFPDGTAPEIYYLN